jgi:gamma-glutamylcyclotransferase (GGCT)/AIG2-like uncharacterized protein YtfP
MEKIFLAVNGTLMRGLELNKSLLDVGAIFVRQTSTKAIYRLWSIDDKYPAMLRDSGAGNKIDLEIWQLSAEALVKILQGEPPGLCVGRLELQDGESVLGVLGEPYICEGQNEITNWGGWRNYVSSLSKT